MPIVDLGQQSAFNPAGAEQWFSYLLVAVGWILATTIAAGIARVITRRQGHRDDAGRSVRLQKVSTMLKTGIQQ